MWPRNLIWKLHWYRASELEGALLLGRLARGAEDGDLLLRLTRHAADEARHAWLWARTIDELKMPTVRIFRPYQSFYSEAGIMPAGIAPALTLTHIFEQRVDRQFHGELENPDWPEPARRTFRALLADEQDHLAWVAQWLAENSEGARWLDHYRRTDAQTFDRLAPFMHQVFAIPGLGKETQPCPQ